MAIIISIQAAEFELLLVVAVIVFSGKAVVNGVSVIMPIADISALEVAAAAGVTVVPAEVATTVLPTEELLVEEELLLERLAPLSELLELEVAVL